MTRHIKTRAKAQKMIRARKIRQMMMMVMTIVIIISTLLLCSYIEQRYTREAVACVEEDGITFVDNMGHEWSADAENVVDGQMVKLKMHTNNTDGNVYDDIVVRVKPMPIRMK